jgi:hypothetical protein
MEAVLLYPDGQMVEAALLSVGRYTMRVVVRGSDETTELTCNYGEWADEAGTPIEFDAIVAGEPDQVRRILEYATATANRLAASGTGA